jgi:hypothetical protein
MEFNTRFAKYAAIAAWSFILSAPHAARASGPPVAIVAETVNSSRDTHTTLARATTDALAVELARKNVYEVVSRKEMERAAKERGLRAPYSETDLQAIAKEAGASIVVTSEIKSVEPIAREKSRGIEVGLIVRARDAASGELVNGAAERAYALEAADGTKTEGLLAMDAASGASARAVAKMAVYTPISGTILSSAGTRGMVLNRGAGHGVKKKQEFLIFRNDILVGRARAGNVSPSYTELHVIENTLGIQAQDHVLSVFPEPKLDK